MPSNFSFWVTAQKPYEIKKKYIFLDSCDDRVFPDYVFEDVARAICSHVHLISNLQVTTQRRYEIKKNYKIYLELSYSGLSPNYDFDDVAITICSHEHLLSILFADHYVKAV